MNVNKLSAAGQSKFPDSHVENGKAKVKHTESRPGVEGDTVSMKSYDSHRTTFSNKEYDEGMA